MGGISHAMKATHVGVGMYRMKSNRRICIKIDPVRIFKGTFHNGHYLVVLQRDYC